MQCYPNCAFSGENHLQFLFPSWAFKDQCLVKVSVHIYTNKKLSKIISLIYWERSTRVVSELKSSCFAVLIYPCTPNVLRNITIHCHPSVLRSALSSLWLCKHNTDLVSTRGPGRRGNSHLCILADWSLVSHGRQRPLLDLSRSAGIKTSGDVGREDGRIWIQFNTLRLGLVLKKPAGGEAQGGPNTLNWSASTAQNLPCYLPGVVFKSLL